MKTNLISCVCRKPKTTFRVIFAKYGVYIENIICIGNHNVNFPNEGSYSRRCDNDYKCDFANAWTSKFTRECGFYRTPYKQTVKKPYTQKFTFARIIIWVPYTQIYDFQWYIDWAFVESKKFIKRATDAQCEICGHMYITNY